MWRKLQMLGLMLLVLAAGGCNEKGPIGVGFAGELTGMQSDLGVQGRNGALIALDEINTAGGINGRTLELLVEDDLGTPEGARQADQKLIDSGVVAIIGHMTSGQTQAGMEVTEPAGMALISPTASSVKLSGLADHLYRMASTSAFEAGLLAEVAWGDQVTAVAIIRDSSNEAYTLAYADGFREVYENLGGKITAEVVYAAKENPDFAALSREVVQNDPMGVLIIAAAMDTALIAQQMRLADWQGAMFSSGWANTDVLIPNGGRALEGMKLTTRHTCLTPRPRYDTFAQQYQERYGKPPANSAEYAYEAMWVLANALQKTGGRADGLGAALLKTQDFQGLMGTFSLDAYGDAMRSACELVIQDGKMQPLQEVEPAK
jgi:branched-chain amino acid transport system substrate-binding protein